MTRTRVRTTLATASGAALLLTLLGPVGVTQAAAPDCDDPTIVGHRGSGGTSPENTIASVRDARRSGAEITEVDVQLTADGVPFIFHDATGGRTSDVEEVFPDRAGDPITSFTWAELQQLDAGEYFAKRYDGEPVPHLNDVARAVAGSPLTVNIEIKSPEDSPGVEAALAEALQTDPFWKRLVERDQVVVSSFDETSLTTFHELMPELPVLQIATEVPDDDATLERWAGFADGLVTNYRFLDPADVDRVRSFGLDLALYTLNSPEAVLEAADLCVDQVITDFPTQMVRLLEGRDPFPQANGIEVNHVLGDAPGDDLTPENGEYVELINTSDRAIDVSGYILQDAVINRLVVGDGYVLAPGATLRVYTGPGTNTEDRYYNDLGRAVLNNDGDSIAVYTPQLRLLDLYAY